MEGPSHVRPSGHCNDKAAPQSARHTITWTHILARNLKENIAKSTGYLYQTGPANALFWDDPLFAKRPLKSKIIKVKDNAGFQDKEMSRDSPKGQQSYMCLT